MIRAALSIGAWTLLSRVTGFLRDALMLAILGAGPVFDAFIVAFKLPNFFRRLSAEGAFSAAFIPQFSGTLAQNGLKEALVFAQRTIVIMVATLCALTAVVIVMTPALMGIFAPGFHGETLLLATHFTRITFSYIVFMSLTALVAGMLNAFDRFSAAAAAPVILNLTMIAALSLAPQGNAHTGYVLCWSVTLAGLGQLLWVHLSLRRAQPSWKFSWRSLLKPTLTSDVRFLIRKMGPGLLSAGVFQVNVLVDVILASFLPSGSLTFLHAADRLNQLPLSVIGVAISTAFLPLLSRQIKNHEHEKALKTLEHAILYALILSIPASVALIQLAPELCHILFARGAFTATHAAASAAALRAFVVGLPAYILIKILSTRYFANNDTTTPMIFGLASVVLNFILNLVLIPHLSHVGIALATALAGWANVVGLAWILFARRHLTWTKILTGMSLLIGVASALMALSLAYSKPYLTPWLHSPSEIERFVALATWVFVGLAIYVFVAWSMKLFKLLSYRPQQ